MASYNLMKKADRDRMYADRKAEWEAARAGRWPRDLDDRMRWLNAPTSQYNTAAVNRRIMADYAAKMCEAGMAYLKDVERRLGEGDPDLAGWEARA